MRRRRACSRIHPASENDNKLARSRSNSSIAHAHSQSTHSSTLLVPGRRLAYVPAASICAYVVVQDGNASYPLNAQLSSCSSPSYIHHAAYGTLPTDAGAADARAIAVAGEHGSRQAI